VLFIPIAWPFLLGYLMFRYWRVTLWLYAVALTAWLLVVHPFWGLVAITLLAMAALLQVRVGEQRIADREALAQRQADRRAAARRAAMELQADLNARALVRILGGSDDD
jgi:hypothetical protein